jgi:hypothetical protein
VFEALHERFAQRQSLIPVFQSHAQTAFEVAMDARNGAHIDQGASVNLPELLGIELLCGR